MCGCRRESSDETNEIKKPCPKCGATDRLKVYIKYLRIYETEDGEVVKTEPDRSTNYLYDICAKCKKLITDDG